MRGDVVEPHALARAEHVAHDRIREQLVRALERDAIAVARGRDAVGLAVAEDQRAEVRTRCADQARQHQLDRALR